MRDPSLLSPGAPELLSRPDFWRLCLGLGMFLVVILLLLQPFGTEHYRSPARMIKLAGYSLCIAAPGLLCHVALKHWRRLVQPQRQAGLEWGLLLTWVGLALLLAYVYSASVIAPRALAWRPALGFAVNFGLPLLLLLLPVLMWWRSRGRSAVQAVHGRPRSADAGGAPAIEAAPDGRVLPSLRLVGRNRGEFVELAPGQFVYAQAQQNYVNLVWWSGAALQQQLLRTTLAALAEQLPGALRIHRSYLVAPEHLLRVEGARRHRQAQVRHLAVHLPVSAEFEPPQAGPCADAIRPSAGISVPRDD